MPIKQVLQNVKKGYVEVFYYPEGDSDEITLLDWGYICIEDIPYKTDFEKDIIYYKKRWCIYMYYRNNGSWGHPFIQIGRKTGYETRKEALKAFRERVCFDWGMIEKE